jgi:hypothetical protein
MDLDEVRRAALPDPHDERDIWCGPELRWCISRIEQLEGEVTWYKDFHKKDGESIRILEAQLVESELEIKQLKQLECDAEMCTHPDGKSETYCSSSQMMRSITDLKKQLAAAQAENKKLLHKLAAQELTTQNMWEALVAAKYAIKPSITLEIIETALSTTSSTEALDEYFTRRLDELMAKAYPSANGKGVRG